MDTEHVEQPEVPQVARHGPDHDAVAAAIERRLQAEREKAAAAAGSSSNHNFDNNHEKRQEFRRMIDPGILRPNPRHVALESLQVHIPLRLRIHPDRSSDDALCVLRRLC